MIATVAFLLGSASVARAQFVPPGPVPPASAQPAAFVPIADAPEPTAWPADMSKLYEPSLTTERPVKYGRLNMNKYRGDFQQETLFEWSVGRDPQKNGDAENDEPEEERLSSDRPDFTEASSTVGRGRVQLESGYTFFSDKSGGLRTHTHSYPEALLRIGLFADWFELRIGENVFTQTTRNGPMRTSDTGSVDLYLGAKLALAKQKGVLPETALILQGTVPTGASAFTTNRVLYGANYLFSWELNDFMSFGGSFQANKAIDDNRLEYALLSQSLTVGYKLAENLTAYTEWFALYPTLATATGGGSQHFLDGGFQYYVTKNFALDIRIGLGLSSSADDFFTGAGFVVRY